jgi:biotin carboxyl carrier protein
MHDEQYKVLVNRNQAISLSEGEVKGLDLVAESNPDEWHLLVDDSSYRVSVASYDAAARSLQVLVNDKLFHVAIENEYDLLVREMGFNAGVAHKISEWRAPMPGLVLDLLVEEGCEVQQGDPLLILEAMKMENIIKATGPGKIGKVHVGKGMAVEKGQLLLEME